MGCVINPTRREEITNVIRIETSNTKTESPRYSRIFDCSPERSETIAMEPDLSPSAEMFRYSVKDSESNLVPSSFHLGVLNSTPSPLPQYSSNTFPLSS